ncbi:MAG TPA: hypothetical protein ENJ46_04360 [Hellea balneolensis]|uniref:Uncharacterized protein n=1 Tax=Hellea balneolensis TaxID=287478 RepID=A0A7C3GLP5_9PROT|nr:hypothetical protein [Hellea balneolensis]
MWVAVGFIALAAVQYIFLPWTAFIEISADLGLGYVVFLAMTRTDPVPTALKRIPDLSLGLYVFNWPVAQITLLVLPTLSPLGLFALSFPLTVIISLACWAILVRPINLLAFPAQHRALLARS